MWNFNVYTVFLEMTEMSCPNKVCLKKPKQNGLRFCDTHILNLFINIPK